MDVATTEQGTQTVDAANLQVTQTVDAASTEQGTQTVEVFGEGDSATEGSTCRTRSPSSSPAPTVVVDPEVAMHEHSGNQAEEELRQLKKVKAEVKEEPSPDSKDLGPYSRPPGF